MDLSEISKQFRTCETTGLKVHLPAQRLIWINAVAAVVFLLIGGLLAILIALTRWPDVHLLPQDLFYRFVTAHGTNMLVFWIVFFEMAGLIFGASIVLGARFPGIGFAWFNTIMMLTGAILVNIMIFMGKADVMFTAYPPLKAHWLFYLGIVLFAVGALFYCFHFLYALVNAKREGWYQGSLPLFVFGLVVAAIIAIFTLVSGAIAFVPTLFWAMGDDVPFFRELIPSIDAEFFRVAFWGFGHSAQQINLAAMVSIWYLLAYLTTNAKPVNQKMCRLAFVLYLLGINMGSVHHNLVDPGLSSTYRIFNTSYFFYAAVIGSMIHAFSIPAAIETAQRKNGLTKGLFEWLIKAPWGHPGFSGLALSFVIFGFGGGVTGVILSVEQLNMLSHNNLRVPGHFHMTVVGGTTLAFMALTYYVIPLVLQRKLVLESLAKYQTYLFGFGVSIFATGMHFAGVMGAPRRHWDISFQNAVFQVPFDPAMNTMLALVGIGATIAFTGLLIFLAIAVLSVFFGKKIPSKMETYMPAHSS
ncbi:MAG: cbb3-type cytochrome c oxidase subunit I [Spirochaetia bacterium]|nr:cbb3-type cytochrome c oxidase subunit I [Spirochaetia bacterium]